MSPKQDHGKPRRASRIYSTVKNAVAAEVQLFHFSAPWHMEHPRPLEPKEEALFKPRKRASLGFRRKSSKAALPPAATPAPPSTRRHPPASQSQCALLQLPCKIRSLIWRAVLGGHLCFGGTIIELSSSYKCYSSNDLIHHSCEWPRKSAGLLSLLMTCQQINTEASPLLLAANAYYHIALPRLGYVNPISPRRLPAFKHLRALMFEVQIDSVLFSNGLFLFRHSSRPLTPATWAPLAQLSSLQILLVNVISHTSVFLAGNGVDQGNGEAEVFAPLVQLRGLQVYEVVVRWKCSYRASERLCQLQNDYADAPFRLTEIVDHVVRDHVVRGSADMVDVRAWTEGIMPLVMTGDV